MHPFWQLVVEPVLDAAGADTVIEIGAEQGRTTALLLDRASRRKKGTVHAIDPAPRFDASEWELEWGERFRFHRGRSLDLLPSVAGQADAVLIDGDHNHYTVLRELALIGRASAESGTPFPVVLAHDVGWPYGRRDLYYDPESIPAEFRHDAARAAILPGRSELGDPGINGGLWNATVEGGPRNGVLTAIEDFVGAGSPPCETVTITGMHGLAVIVSRELLQSSADMSAEFDALASVEFLSRWTEQLEAARIQAEIRASAAVARDARQAREMADRDKGLLD